MTHRFESYDAYAGDISTRSSGSLVSSRIRPSKSIRNRQTTKKEEHSSSILVRISTQAK